MAVVLTSGSPGDYGIFDLLILYICICIYIYIMIYIYIIIYLNMLWFIMSESGIL